MNAETTYKEVSISSRERALLRYIRQQEMLEHQTMVVVQSANGKKGFGFPSSGETVIDREAYIEM